MTTAATTPTPAAATAAKHVVGAAGRSKKPTNLEAKKVHRLAQNRKAARESRKRKKAMIEDLQKSLVFFSKTNAELRNQHHELTRLLLNAQSAIRKTEEEGSASSSQQLPQKQQSKPAASNATPATTAATPIAVAADTTPEVAAAAAVAALSTAAAAPAQAAAGTLKTESS